MNIESFLADLTRGRHRLSDHDGLHTKKSPAKVPYNRWWKDELGNLQRELGRPLEKEDILGLLEKAIEKFDLKDVLEQLKDVDDDDVREFLRRFE